jgi:hypothetical protein
MSPESRLARGAGEAVDDVVKYTRNLSTNGTESDDGNDRDQGNDEAVFNESLAGFVLRVLEANHKLGSDVIQELQSGGLLFSFTPLTELALASCRELAGPGTTRLPVLVPTAGLLELDFAVVRRHLRLHQAYDVSAMLGDVFSTYEYSAAANSPEGYSLTFLAIVSHILAPLKRGK